MTNAWVRALTILDKDVNEFVDELKDWKADNYQLKLDVWKSISRKALVGRLTHLPTKKTCPVWVGLPI